MNPKENLLTKVIPYILYFLVLLFIFQFRAKLDKTQLYITSDGAIKLYQTAGYEQNGFLSLECIYPSKEIDAAYHYYPISYPWAIFSAKNLSCVLEYPPFFYWLGALVLKIASTHTLLYLPLLFYGINLLLFDFILKRFGLMAIYRIPITLLAFISFPLLTAMDYTESPAFQTFYLLGFFFFWRLIQNSHLKSNLILSGVCFGLAFFLRLEILIPFAFLGGVYFLFTRNFKNSIWIGFSFLFVAGIFILYNLKVSGHPLGFRYVSSIDFNDNAKADLVKRFHFLKATLWGNEIMVGVFKFQPLLWLLLLVPVIAFFQKIKSSSGLILLVAGWMSLFVIPLYITVYGGVGYFGLRYIEAPFYLIILGSALYLSDSFFSKSNLQKVFFVFLLVIIGYFNWLSTREGLKILRNSSIENVELQTYLEKSNRYVIHSSFYTSIWMGNSFLTKRHVHVKGDSEMNRFLENIPPKEAFVMLLSPPDIYISQDIPKKLHPDFLEQINLDNLPIQILDEKKLNNVRMILANKK